MKGQNISKNASLMVLWSLFPFGRIKATPYTADTEPDAIGQFKIYDNYPNPFRTITMIYFSLMHTSSVRIDIHDASGKKLLTLMDDILEPGVQRVPLYRVTNGITLKPGHYTYKLSVSNGNGNFAQRKPITLLD